MTNAEHKQWRDAHIEQVRAINRKSGNKWRNSHRPLLAKLARERRAKVKAVMNGFKSQPCMDCGISYPPCVMDFDHRPGTYKIDHVGRLLSSRNPITILDEIRKCDVVCSNCHRI